MDMNDHSGSEDTSGDGEGVWSPDIEQCFREALLLFPPCGRRKHILQEEGGGKMYGRNELIARHIMMRTGKSRTRKQVSSHIQVLARRKAKAEAVSTPSTSTISASSMVSPNSTGRSQLRPQPSTGGSGHRLSGTGTTLDGQQNQVTGAYVDVWADRPIVTQKIRLVEFSAFIEYRNFQNSQLRSRQLITGAGSGGGSPSNGQQASLLMAQAVNLNHTNSPGGLPTLTPGGESAYQQHQQPLHSQTMRATTASTTTLTTATAAPTATSSSTSSSSSSETTTTSTSTDITDTTSTSATPAAPITSTADSNTTHPLASNHHLPAQFNQATYHPPDSSRLVHPHNHHHHNQQHQKSSHHLIQQSQHSHGSHHCSSASPNGYPLQQATSQAASTTTTNSTSSSAGFSRHSYVCIDYSQPGCRLGNKIERVDISQIQDKFPEISGSEGLFQRGPSDAFFLVKFWADLAPVDYKYDTDEQNSFFGFSSRFETAEPCKDITCSTKVCSYGLQVVEKVEKIYGAFNNTNGRFSFDIIRSPMCEFMTQFIKKLRQLPRSTQMNSVLENFTVLQVVSSESTSEILLCLAYVFEITPTEPDQARYHVYKLTKD